MIRSAFTRYLTVFVCVICAALLITTVIAAMRAEGSFAQTSQEPFLVKDINPTGDSSPSVLTNFDNSLFFAASDGDYGTGLWLSDGTITGTELISGVVLGGWTGTYHDMVQFKERLYLNTGYRIWMSDGTPEGTMPLIPHLPGILKG